MVIVAWTLVAMLAPGAEAPSAAAEPAVAVPAVAVPAVAVPAVAVEVAPAPEPAVAPLPEAAPQAEPAPAVAPVPAIAAAPPVVVPEDRIDLRDGGMIVGRVVEVRDGNYVTIVVSQTGQSRTVGWALIDAYRMGDGPEQIASRGKPTIADLAAESDSIERQKNIGLGLAYGGYVSAVISLSLWTATGISTQVEDGRPEPLLVAAMASTAVTAGLLAGGGVMFFKAKNRRAELRRVQVSGGWLPGGGGLQLQGRF